MDVLLHPRFKGHGALPVFLLLLPGLGVAAEPARVHFDASPKVAYRPLDDESFRQANPGERLWEARVSISAFVPDAQNYVDVEHHYVLRTSSNDVLIEDYQPQTLLGSEYTGTIVHEEKSEFSRSLGVAVTGIQDCLVKASGNGDLGKKETNSVRYELAPPQETLIASGTLQRGRAVYFKLRPAAQVTLEGAKEFTLILRAPDDWRIDTLQVGCQAVQRKRTMLSASDERTTVGAAKFVVALYAAGDHDAKALADEFVVADRELRAAANAFVRRSQDRRGETFMRQLTTWIDPGRSPTAPAEVSRLLSGQTSGADIELERLPEDLRVPASELLAVRSRFGTLREASHAATRIHADLTHAQSD